MEQQDPHETFIDPGRSSRSLLTLQDKHISTHVWNTSGDANPHDRVLNVRHAASPDHLDIPKDIHPYLRQAGFYHVARLRNHEIDHSLISALVERWRPETRTFHMSMGEVTITLEDVHHLLGLPTDGEVVCGRVGGHPFSVLFLHYHEHAGTEVGRMRYTRALILRILGGCLFVETASSFVHAWYLLFLDDFQWTGMYSWGSAMLATLYRELCKVTDSRRSDMGGCALLLQLWACTRFPTISPGLPEITDAQAILGARFNVYTQRRFRFSHIRRYRHHIDVMPIRRIRWRPYQGFATHHPSSEESRRWLAVCPLIHYQIVVYQQPDRVLQQFCFRQPIPSDPLQCSELLTITLTGKGDVDWRDRHGLYIAQWYSRDALVVQGLQPDEGYGHLSINNTYIQWYFEHTRKWMMQRSAIHSHVSDRIETVVHMASDEAQGAFTYRQIYDEALQAMSTFAEFGRLTDPGEPVPPPVVVQTVEPPRPPRRSQRARHEGLPLHHQTPVAADRPVHVQSLPPRPVGQFYAPAYPSGGPSQPYWWTSQSVPPTGTFKDLVNTL
ncbi:serine/threonine-protein phosphatase 7 long form homolog [Gastrolobium bilobum]|uniref:serine/threonine-protein phosphatase 7 long form homolog n=1 Tax=Gastrolobium bilobum TaxID=150636 RepID=UPI002AAF300D|nr:serine/threonine-protein phosphatase 7 long form homolog [Gastrolobium bilobum]